MRHFVNHAREHCAETSVEDKPQSLQRYMFRNFKEMLWSSDVTNARQFFKWINNTDHDNPGNRKVATCNSHFLAVASNLLIFYQEKRDKAHAAVLGCSSLSNLPFCVCSNSTAPACGFPTCACRSARGRIAVSRLRRFNPRCLEER